MRSGSLFSREWQFETLLMLACLQKYRVALYFLHADTRLYFRMDAKRLGGFAVGERCGVVPEEQPALVGDNELPVTDRYARRGRDAARPHRIAYPGPPE